MVKEVPGHAPLGGVMVPAAGVPVQPEGGVKVKNLPLVGCSRVLIAIVAVEVLLVKGAVQEVELESAMTFVAAVEAPRIPT